MTKVSNQKKPPVKSTAKSSTSSAKKSQAKKQPLAKNHQKGGLRYELKLLALLVVTVFMLIALMTESAGRFGLETKNFLLGLLSLSAYFLPLYGFTMFFLAMNPNFKAFKLRIQIAISALYGSIILFVGLTGVQDVSLNPFSVDGFNYAYDLGVVLRGPGAIGNMLFTMVYAPFGQLGTILIIVAFIILFLTLSFHVTPSKILNAIGFSAVKTKDTLVKTNQSVNTALKQGIDQMVSDYDANEDKRKETRRHILDLMNKDLFPGTKAKGSSDEKSLYQPDYSKARVTEDIMAVDVQQVDIQSVTAAKDEPSIPIILPPIDESDAVVEDALKNIKILDFQENSKKRVKVPSIMDVDLELDENAIPIIVLQDDSLLEEASVVEDTVLEQVTQSIEEYTKDASEGDLEPMNDEVFDYEHYVLPPLELLKEGLPQSSDKDRKEILIKVRILEDTLSNFKIDAKVVQVSKGPMITRFEIQPSPGVKVSRIVNLADDIALNLAATTIRIVAPIPGKAAVGIEVPNKTTSVVTLRDVIESDTYEALDSVLRFGLGKEISGLPIVADLAKMPHLLIAGSTGSGKSVCVNTIISSILYNSKPDEVKFLMIDPKVVELNVYNGIPHLILPVVTDPKKASIALNWAVQEMTDRYNRFAEVGVRDVTSYNKKYEITGDGTHMPRIVVIIDELADLMMVAPNQVEDAICRLAQMARAAGIHLIVATQRPSVDVITGVIKANIPSRIAFSVSSQIDSRTIIDMAGAEKLLGKGDMLYFPVGESKPKRVQGSFISEEEVECLVTYVKEQVGGMIHYNTSVLDDVKYQQNLDSDADIDDLLEDAVRFVIETEKASTSLIQRRFRVGYNRAARLVDELEARGIVGPSRGSKPREVLMTLSDYQKTGEN